MAARRALQIEAEALSALASQSSGDTAIVQAVELIVGHKGKIVVTGVGKSGHVARQIAATFSSTGTPAVFLHPAEALHGDLGVCQSGDPVLMISKSGATVELLDLISPLRCFEAPLIGILGNPLSPLAREVDVVLNTQVQREADPQGFTPTASTIAALAMGHALAIGLMDAREFSTADFHRLHPSGHLGTRLGLRVRDVMHSGDEIASVRPADSLKNVVIELSARPLGAACVVSSDGSLAGLITDGDVRRALRQHDDIRTLSAQDVMTVRPIVVSPDAKIHKALQLMEDRPSQISVLPVVEDGTGTCIGLIRVHDIYHHQAVE